ncbi:MAG: hypothetical protein ACKVU1_11800 [bacterium]
MRYLPLRFVVGSRLPIPFAPFRGVARRLYVIVGSITLLVVTLVTGIWQKNQIDAILRRIDGLERERGVLLVEIEQEEMEIARLASYDCIVPRAENELGMIVMASSEQAFLPLTAPMPEPAPPLEGHLQQFVASLSGAVDFVLPGTSTAKEKEGESRE